MRVLMKRWSFKMNDNTTVSEIDKALGIDESGSIESIIYEFDEELKELNSGMGQAVDKIDNKLADNKTFHNIDDTFGELSELIQTAKGMLSSVYTYVTTSNIVDPDVVRSGADLLRSCRETVSDYLEVYKDKIKHANSIELEMIKFENRKELERLKHELKNIGKADVE